MSFRPYLLALALALAGCAAAGPTAPGAGAPADGGVRASAAVSFARDVAPLVTRSCQGCHRETGSGSRTLVLFDPGGGVRHDAMARKIAAIIRECRTGSMPEGSNPKLNASEVALLQAWQAAGTPDN